MKKSIVFKPYDGIDPTATVKSLDDAYDNLP